MLLFRVMLPALPQEREYIYDHYNISNGLISDNVFKIFTDLEGHAWIITYNGLQKYNGYEFRTYSSRAGESGSLTSNYVENMFEDRNGDLIVVLEDGIDIYHKQVDRFSNLVKGLPFGDSRRNEISRHASAVQDRNGSIWVNCNNQMVRINSGKSDFFVYQDELRGQFVINRDSTLLWIIKESEIKRYHIDSKLLTIYNISDLPAPEPIYRLNTIYYDSKGICWIATSEGLFILDEDKMQFKNPDFNLFMNKDETGGITDRNITSIYEDFRNNLWIASGSTLFKITRDNHKIQVLRHETDNVNSLMDAQITGIFGSGSGIIWITYLNEGCTRININTNNFMSYRYKADRSLGLGGKTVRSVYKDQKDFIWLGLYNEGLDRINSRTGEITHFRHDLNVPGTICSNYISSLFLDDHQRIWVGSHDNGLCYADGAYQDQLVFNVPGFLNENDEIYHILGDSLGRIWIGTRYGLGMFDYSTGEFNWILKNHNVQSFLFDGDIIWISSWNHGLGKLVFEPGQFNCKIPVFDRDASMVINPEVISPEENDNGKLNPGVFMNCISIYQDRQKRIWLGTYDRGLVKAIDNNGLISYYSYDVSKGAPGNAVYGVVGDEQGNIWISTENGLGKFDPVTEHFENYYREDGLLSNFFMWKSYFRTSDGELFFGSMNGLTFFYPREIFHNPFNSEILFTELRIQNRVVEPGDSVNGDVILRRHINYQDTLVLNYRNRNFSFRFNSNDQLNHNRIKYSHMLVGFDEDWIENEPGNRSAYYNNLSRGTYHFRVRATGDASVWDGNYAEKLIIVLPPWWKTNTAMALYTIFILGLIFVISHSMVRFLKLKNELFYNEKLHQSKLMFFTNISHEFKTPLSLIKAPLDDILNEKELSPHNRKNLQIARKNADDMLNLVSELLEFRRTDAGISKLSAEEIDLTGSLKEIIQQFETLAEHKGIHFYYNIPSNPVKIWADRKKFRRIINNLLENAFRYTREEGLVTLSLITNPSTFRFNPDYHTLRVNKERTDLQYIGILVSDTGVGISKDSLPRIFDRFYQIEAERASHHIGSGIGLALVKNLVLLHHGEIRVASERGRGTEILVLFPSGDSHLKQEEKYGVSVVSEPDHPVIRERKTFPLPATARELEVHKIMPSILLVEDHHELRAFLKEHLSADYRVLEAENGLEGLKIATKEHPDLIITDWILPVMDGSELIGRIKEQDDLAPVPIILLTAKDDLVERQEGLDIGADLVITKPFNLQLLLSQVKRTIENDRRRRKNYSLNNPGNVTELRESMDADFVSRLERAIKKHIKNNKLNAAIIAREIGMSRTVLYHKTHTVIGSSIGDYIQQVRLKLAIRLMLYEGKTVSEVYIMVGFSSSSYMIRLFRKHYHCTPGEYIRTFLKTSAN